MKTFRDRVVVITGAASGIGLALAKAFCDQGSLVHLVDIADPVHERARSLGERARAHQADVTDAAAVARVAGAVIELDGRVDVLVNNAGMCAAGPAERLTLHDWRRHIDLNLWGVIHGIHAFLPRMLEQGHGHIVNVASMAGLLPFPMVAPYCASKFAVVGLSESLAAELAPRDIHVTLVCPGAVRTGLLDRARADLDGERARTVVELFELTCASPDEQARDILRAVRERRTVLLSPGLMLPLVVLQRASRGLYNRMWKLATRLAAGKRITDPEQGVSRTTTRPRPGASTAGSVEKLPG